MKITVGGFGVLSRATASALGARAPSRERPAAVDDITGFDDPALALGELDVVLHHHLNQLVERNARPPPKRVSRLGRVPTEIGDLGRTQILVVDLHVLPPVHPLDLEGGLDEVPYRVGLSGCDYPI